MSTLLTALRRLFGTLLSRGTPSPGIPDAGVVVPKPDRNLPAPLAPNPQPSPYKTPFVRSFEPLKTEKKLISGGIYPHGYRFDFDALRFKEVFRSPVEVEWAKAFDKLGLPWEYEPLKFDMGPEHVSYTPDFRVTGLSIPDSNRALYIEVKWFGEPMYLTKYVRFTEWYNCDLLILAHNSGGVLRPRKEKYFLVLKCAQCNAYDCFACGERPTASYRPQPAACVTEPPFAASGSGGCPRCQATRLERIVVPSFFLIQAGTIGKGRVVLPGRGSCGGQIQYILPQRKLRHTTQSSS
jgi:hypothetical protein